MLRERVEDAVWRIRERDEHYGTLAATTTEFKRRLEECVRLNGGPVYLN